jgi:hypothetical protein
MRAATDYESLLEQIAADGMFVRSVLVPVQDVVYFKSVLEAYPGLAAVHAERGQASGGSASLVVATTPELAGELDGVLDELSREIGMSIGEQATT